MSGPYGKRVEQTLVDVRRAHANRPVAGSQIGLAGGERADG